MQAQELRIGGLENRTWKNIKGWEDYSVSDFGEIYSHRRGKLLKVFKPHKSYPRISLSKNGVEKSFCIHKLVAKAFIPNPLNKKTVNHIDANKNNNHVSNLEWCTMMENIEHAIKLGLCVVPELPNGEKHPAAKLSNIDVEMIRILLKHDFTKAQIAKRFGVHETHISSIALNKTRVYG